MAKAIGLVCVALFMAACIIATAEATHKASASSRVKVNAGATSGAHAADKADAKGRSISYTEAALADEVINLPGAPEITFRHFAGYLTVDQDAGRKLFYWFVESEHQPATDAVALWTNGGPGCSGLLGMLTEQGPFRPREDGTIELNEYAWNKVSSMMFIEAPAGVGFSYSETARDYIDVGDYHTSHDNYKAILQFFIRFPHLLSNEFYIASESYGGHYMPTLAKVIVEGNIAGVNQAINFKGFAVGNPYTDPISNGIYGEFPTYWGHQLVSKANWDLFVEHCYTTPDGLCPAMQWRIYDEIGDIDPYALDFPTCESGSSLSSSGAKQAQRMHDSIMKNRGMTGKAKFSYDACSMDWAAAYLARADVIAALHANADLPYDWAECSSILQYNYTDMATYMEPLYLDLLELQPDIKMLVYSGDNDAVCATIGTQYWIYDLGLPLKKAWTAWYLNGQLGGYIVHFDGLTFMTVHGAGHMVPATQPERALFLWSSYLTNTLPFYNDLDSSVVNDGSMPEDDPLFDTFEPYPTAPSTMAEDVVAAAIKAPALVATRKVVVVVEEEKDEASKTEVSLDAMASTLSSATSSSPQQKIKAARAGRRRAAVHKDKDTSTAAAKKQKKAAVMAKLAGGNKGAYHPHRHAEARRAVNRAVKSAKLH